MSRRAGLAAPLLLCVVMLAATGARAAGCKLTQAEMRVRIIEQRPIATLTLNGVDMPMLVDTGAFFSWLSPAAAAQLNLPLRRLPPGLRAEGYTGRIEAKVTRVDKVTLLGHELREVEFLVGGNALNAGVMGMLGRNFLSRADTEYDLAQGVVRLTLPEGDCENADLAYWAGEAPVVVVPLTSSQSHQGTAIRVDVSINGKERTALLDTGAPQTALTLRAARASGIEERDLTPYGRTGGVGEGRAKSWVGPVATFELGGQKIQNSRMRIDDVAGDVDLLVGLDYFLAHRIYVSRLQRRVYITWNGGAVFAPNIGSAVESDARSAAAPAEVDDQDADALARRGAAALAARNHARALADLNRACELAPQVADNFHLRARIHLAMGQSRPALTDFDEALRLDAGLAQARMQRAVLRAGTGDRAGAHADLQQLDATLPPSAPLRAGMGLLHAELDQVPEALRQFELWAATHARDQGLAEVLNSRCWLRARLNVDLPLALRDCKDAVDRDDGESAFHDSLGWVYLRLGDAERAKKAFDSAIQLHPLAFSLYGRALALLRLSDAAGSKRDLAAALQLNSRIGEEVRRVGFEFAAELERPRTP